MPNVTPAFKQALLARRTKQAHIICEKLRREFAGKTILDYGCGQGAFAQFLACHGFHSLGCDLRLTNCECLIAKDRFVQISMPWEVPPLDNVHIVTMLDVLEHCPEPGTFLAKLRRCGVEGVLIKVPMLYGPLGMLSLSSCYLKKYAILEKMLLVGEVSPHCFFFTMKGLLNLLRSSGFSVKRILRFPDVGSELPRRYRTPTGLPISGVPALIMTAFGFGLQVAAPIWSDTAAVYATV